MEDIELFLATLTADTNALRDIIAINLSLAKIFDGNKYNMISWLTTANPDMQNKKPVELMLDSEKKMKDVRSYLEQARDRGA